MKREIELGEYELEWLEPEPDVDTKLDDPKAAKGIERLKKHILKPFVHIVVSH